MDKDLTISELKEYLDIKFDGVDRDISDVRSDIVAGFAKTDSDIADIKSDITGLREATQSLIISVDKMTKSIETLSQEYAAMTAQLDRHEEWIKQIADKVGVKLGY